MKTKLIILLLLISISAMSQQSEFQIVNGKILMGWEYEETTSMLEKSYLDLRREYKEYCDKEETDTIKELGLIFTYIEVDHDILVVIKDTTWSDNYAALRSLVGFNSGNMTYVDSLNRIRIEVRKYKTESPEGFWNWVDENYLK